MKSPARPDQILAYAKSAIGLHLAISIGAGGQYSDGLRCADHTVYRLFTAL
jgi:hypothetical protein